MEKIKQLQSEFIFNEIFQASIYASFSTRNLKFPIYGKNIIKPKTLTTDLKDMIQTYVTKFKAGHIDEFAHFEEILNMSTCISDKYEDALHNGRFRIGTSQKLLNLVLKYLWCIGEIEVPHHCPIDSIIIKKFNPTSNTSWTQLDSIIEYKEYIDAIRELIGKNTSIAKWELEVWNRRPL